MKSFAITALFLLGLILASCAHSPPKEGGINLSGGVVETSPEPLLREFPPSELDDVEKVPVDFELAPVIHRGRSDARYRLLQTKSQLYPTSGFHSVYNLKEGQTLRYNRGPTRYNPVFVMIDEHNALRSQEVHFPREMGYRTEGVPPSTFEADFEMEPCARVTLTCPDEDGFDKQILTGGHKVFIFEVDQDDVWHGVEGGRHIGPGRSLEFFVHYGRRYVLAYSNHGGPEFTKGNPNFPYLEIGLLQEGESPSFKMESVPPKDWKRGN